MTEAMLLTHVAAFFVGIVGTYGYLKHIGGWQSALQADIALIKHSLGLGTVAHSVPPVPSVPVAPVSSPGAAGTVTHPT